jgi:transposase-like protein
MGMLNQIVELLVDKKNLCEAVVQTCENNLFILVDGGPWYRWAFQRLGLVWEHQTFGERNHIEQWFC